MTKVNFTLKTNINFYLNNDLNFLIFNELEGSYKNLFDPLDFFNLLYEQLEIICANWDDIILIRDHLLKLNLDKWQLWFLLKNLIVFIERGNNLPIERLRLRYCLKIILIEWEKMDKELNNTGSGYYYGITTAYNFKNLLNHLKTLPNTFDKIKYLMEEKTKYLQNKTNNGIEIEPDFDKQCELEISRLTNISGLEISDLSQKKQMFKLSSKKGAKTDLIRILNAIYELRLIEKADGLIPSKKEFIEALGNFLGTDLSNYHTNLSQALKNQPLEANLKIFEDMKNIIQKAHYTNE